MDASESRRAERKERRDRERRRKGAEQSDKAFGGDDVAVRVREPLPMSPRRSTTKRARSFFPARPRGSLTHLAFRSAPRRSRRRSPPRDAMTSRNWYVPTPPPRPPPRPRARGVAFPRKAFFRRLSTSAARAFPSRESLDALTTPTRRVNTIRVCVIIFIQKGTSVPSRRRPVREFQDGRPDAAARGVRPRRGARREARRAPRRVRVAPAEKSLPGRARARRAHRA